MTWRGRNSEAPTEIFIPPHFNPKKISIITENSIDQKIIANAVTVFPDVEGPMVTTGHRVLVWDDAEPSENKKTMHFILIVNDEDRPTSSKELKLIQAKIIKSLRRKKSPVFLLGKVRPEKAPKIHK